MGILRTDIISHSQLEGTGSVEFDGNGDSLTFTTNGGLSLETDFTIEFYIFNNTIALDTQHPSPVTMPAESGHNSQIYTNSSNNYYGLYKQADIVTTGNNSALTGVWQHVAFTRKGSICFAFLDGVLKNTAVSTVTFGGTSGTYRLGSYTGTGGDVDGFISNLRIIKGTAIYTTNFTSPKFELKNIAGTTLLGCQSTTSATDFAVTPNTITANNDAAASAFHPGLKKDATDTGVVFDGVTTFDSQAYMVPPSGKTTERNRGRGLILGAAVSPGGTNTDIIKYFDVASQGITETFGNLTDPDGNGRRSLASVSSSTRACTGGGYSHGSSPGTVKNIIDFVTIANTGNATDFGDMQNTAYAYAPASNQTRGLFAGGYQPNNSTVVNTIDLITIATTGNASNFGDLTVRRRALAGLESTTRGVFAGGTFPAVHDEIDFVTFSTTGNATDFGDLTDERDNVRASSSSTRGVMGGGRTPSNTNIIDFITIASAGNAVDFGDLLAATYYYAATGNKTRAVWAGDVSITNTMEFVTIATAGNSVDFGDQNGTPQTYNGCASDSHGGLE